MYVVAICEKWLKSRSMEAYLKNIKKEVTDHVIVICKNWLKRRKAYVKKYEKTRQMNVEPM